MTPDFDFNHDGKVDMQDVHLYEISSAKRARTTRQAAAAPADI